MNNSIGSAKDTSEETYNNCNAETIYYDATASSAAEGYIVSIFPDGRIEVKYDADGTPVCYRGQEIGAGHYSLTCPEYQGKASLHRMPGGKIMEGYWVEEGWRGMWRIFLNK